MSASPCRTCTRVADPDKCENKNCQVWQRWFINSWDGMRAYPRVVRDFMSPQPVGVPLGGRHYAAPHEVMWYMGIDPCSECLCNQDLCKTPCRVRLAWEKFGEEVGV